MAIRDVAVLALYNDDGQILLQHRDKNMERLPDHWAFFGGGIESEETPEQALEREILEELEYRVRTPELMYVQKFMYRADENTKYVFAEKFDDSQRLTQHEGDAMKWMRFEDLDGLLIVDHDRLALAKIRELGN